MKETKLLSVKRFAESHPSFSEASIRHLAFHSEKNGFKKCIRRIGRRVLIDEAAFFAWVEAQNNVHTA